MQKLVAEMSHDDVLDEIKSGMKKAKCAFDIKTEASFSWNLNNVYEGQHLYAFDLSFTILVSLFIFELFNIN